MKERIAQTQRVSSKFIQIKKEKVKSLFKIDSEIQIKFQGAEFKSSVGSMVAWKEYIFRMPI